MHEAEWVIGRFGSRISSRMLVFDQGALETLLSECAGDRMGGLTFCIWRWGYLCYLLSGPRLQMREGVCCHKVCKQNWASLSTGRGFASPRSFLLQLSCRVPKPLSLPLGSGPLTNRICCPPGPPCQALHRYTWDTVKALSGRRGGWKNRP